MARYAHFDFESRSRVDLRKCGTDRYARDPSTRVLMLNYALDNHPVHLWEPHKGPMPRALRKMLLDPNVECVAHNAQFERAIFLHVLGIDIPNERWICTQAMAASLALPLGLGELTRDALRFPADTQKDKDGRKLILTFCKPRSRITEKKPWEFDDWDTQPEAWQRFCDYGAQDVVAERKVFKILSGYITDLPEMRRLWCMGQKINERGVPIDMALVRGAQVIAKKTKKILREKMVEVSGLANPNSATQALAWLQENGYPYANLRKERVVMALEYERKAMTKDAVMFLKLRQHAAKTSNTKYDAIERAVSESGLLRYMFQFRAASRTGRYGGRVVQLQNLPRPHQQVKPYLDDVRQMIRDEDFESLRMLFDNPLDVLSSSIRSAICAPQGYVFTVADLAAIELAVLAWLTNCTFWLDVLRKKLDPYKAFGVHFLDKPYEQITKEERDLCKPGALGCFGAETKTLTKRGWIPIIDVQLDDLVFDGVDFVQHDGVVDKGVRSVIDLSGVDVTPEHLILCGESTWKPAQHVAREPSVLSQATGLATGLLSRSNELRKDEGNSGTTTCVGANTALANTWSGKETWKKANRLVVRIVRRASRMTQAARYTAGWVLAPITLSGCPTGSTRCVLGASAARARWSATRVEESSVVSTARSGTSSTWSHWTAGITRNFRLIAKTITDTTKRATCISSPVLAITGTKEQTETSVTREENIRRKSFTKLFASVIETLVRSPGRSGKDLQVSRSSTDKRPARARTVYDIANAGPRSRFTILTNEGPLIVHNSGYRLGGGFLREDKNGDTVKTGLFGYAESMGIKMTQEQAATAVSVYRSLSPEIVQSWYDLEAAFLDTIRDKQPRKVLGLVIDIRAPFLRIRLPSGRYLHYCRPKIENRRFQVGTDDDGNPKYKWGLNMTYEGSDQTSGKWVRMATHGGRGIENCTQAIALDVLNYGIEQSEMEGFKTVLHVHDENGTLRRIDDEEHNLDALCEVITRTPPWADGMPLSAAGYDSDFYQK